jgi:hypothetical protein
LEELAESDWAQLSMIRNKIVEELEKSMSDADKKLAEKWKGYKFDTDVESRNKFINEILESKTEVEGKKSVPTVSFNLSYAFFADCVNETILL